MKRFFENLWAALAIAFHVLTGPLLRAWRTRWGATPDDLARTYPGDEIVLSPRWSYTHAIAVAAPAHAVWPFVVQVGQGRGGWYSYEGLENLAGCRIRNVLEVRPDLQILAVGDEVRVHPRAPGLPVRIVQPGRALVLGGDAGDGESAGTWAFHLVPTGIETCRLVERGRNTYGRSLASRLGFGPWPIEPIGFVMSRKMLRTIRDLAESSWRRAPHGASPAPYP